MKLLKPFIVLMPWKLKRFFLGRFFGYELHPTARIGLAWIFPGKLVMKEKTVIDHFSVAIHLDLIVMESGSFIGRSNWITGMSAQSPQEFFNHQTDRKAELILEKEANVTKKHHLDCTNTIRIGAYSTIAGYDSQFLTHSIDVYENRQHSEPIEIGEYTFVGTNVVVLGGSVLPPRSVLGAKSLLNRKFEDEWKLYGGVPAKPVADLDKSAKYFTRKDGFVY